MDTMDPTTSSTASIRIILCHVRSLSSSCFPNLPSSVLHVLVNSRTPSLSDNRCRISAKCSSGGKIKLVKTTQKAPMKLIT
mmetsp:Transcript_8849/g.18994  ORF Transcript_8849/g.18994 Transcript_8849/m.18994 type:complete len:81 (-) Transcript_8849:1499-1741(-)